MGLRYSAWDRVESSIAPGAQNCFEWGGGGVDVTAAFFPQLGPRRPFPSPCSWLSSSFWRRLLVSRATYGGGVSLATTWRSHRKVHFATGFHQRTMAPGQGHGSEYNLTLSRAGRLSDGQVPCPWRTTARNAESKQRARTLRAGRL